MNIEIGEESFTKKPSVIEEIAYRDTWGKGADRASGTERTQAQAEREAKRLASLSGGGEVRIHSEDGRIRDSDTIKPANDPNPPKDKKF